MKASVVCFVAFIAIAAMNFSTGSRLPRQLTPQLIGDGGAPAAVAPVLAQLPAVVAPIRAALPAPLRPNINRAVAVQPGIPGFFDRAPSFSLSPFDVVSSKRVADATNLFTWDSYRALNIPPQENVFYSPYSIVNALGMLTLGTSGNTANQLKDVLRIDPIARRISDSFHKGLGSLNEKLVNDKTALFAIGNRFFVDSGSVDNINPDYLNQLHENYNSSMDVVDFSTNPPKARKTINDWVSQTTFGKINNFLPADLDPLTKLILVNTIYFNGRWALPFSPNLTANGEFQTASGAPVTVPYMYLQGPLNYAKDQELGIESVILPYQRFKYAMHIILPSPDTTLAAVESQLSAGYLQKLAKSSRQMPVVLKMPKFTLKQRLSLKDMLARMNATDVFNPAKADFSNIFVNNRPGMVVDDAIHEALVEVNEDGTVAAAATGIVVLRIAQPTQFVTVDRPFLFYIADQDTGVILFWGRVTNPSSQ